MTSVPLPQPKAGMVVLYEYLWARQHNKGWSNGEKVRPCAILAVVEGKDDTTVYVSPMTHTAPFHPEESILLSQETQARLGFDSHNSWLMCNEVNKFTWPSPDLRRVYRQGKPAGYCLCMLPEEVLKDARKKLKDFSQQKVAHFVPRDEVQQAPPRIRASQFTR